MSVSTSSTGVGKIFLIISGFTEFYNMLRLTLYALLIIFVVMQLFQPERNISSANLKTDIANHYKLPDSVEHILTTVCYDCHSNNTDYPWFINVQPIGWYMQSKITKGKQHINFSDFGSYTKEQAMKKLDDVVNMMKTNNMPLRSYKWYNSDANLTDAQRNVISTWALQLKERIRTDSSSAVNPDSVGLVQPPPPQKIQAEQ
jgi:hypothetical protein